MNFCSIFLFLFLVFCDFTNSYAGFAANPSLPIEQRISAIEQFLVSMSGSQVPVVVAPAPAVPSAPVSAVVPPVAPPAMAPVAVAPPALAVAPASAPAPMAPMAATAPLVQSAPMQAAPIAPATAAPTAPALPVAH